MVKNKQFLRGNIIISEITAYFLCYAFIKNNDFNLTPQFY